MRAKSLAVVVSIAGLSAALLACAAVAASPAAALYRPECRVASPRVPPALAGLPWVGEASADTHVFAGEALASAPADPGDVAESPAKADADESSAWAVTGGIHLVLREVDLNGDRLCDLVATVRTAVSTGGDSESNLVFWFASPKGWRRQGADWGERASTLNPLSRELLGPDNAADAARYGFGAYAPMRLSDGRVVLAARASQGRAATQAAPVTVLAFEAKQSAMSPLTDSKSLAGALGALGDRVCVTEGSTDEACLTWGD